MSDEEMTPEEEVINETAPQPELDAPDAAISPEGELEPAADSGESEEPAPEEG